MNKITRKLQVEEVCTDKTILTAMNKKWVYQFENWSGLLSLVNSGWKQVITIVQPKSLTLSTESWGEME